MSNERMIEVLEAIRDEARTTNSRLESVENRLGRIEQYAEQLGGGLDQMSRRQTESELRLATEILTLADVTRQVRDLPSTRLDDHQAVVDHERRLVELERRLR